MSLPLDLLKALGTDMTQEAYLADFGSVFVIVGVVNAEDDSQPIFWARSSVWSHFRTQKLFNVTIPGAKHVFMSENFREHGW